MDSAGIYHLGKRQVVTGSSYYLAPGAVLVGSVVLGEDVSIWFNAVLRADNDDIRIGRGSNIQDGSVLHVDPGFPLTIGERVTIGHKVMLHGCTIGDESLVGMNAVVLNGAQIGRQCVIGAGALIKEGMVIPDRSLVVGAPGRIIREVSDGMLAGIRDGVEVYIAKLRTYRQQLERVDH